MKTRKPQTLPGSNHLGHTANIRMLTSRILEFADSGVPRAQFLKEVARILIEFTGCDVIRLVLNDRGRCFRCELTGNEALERLCRDIVGQRTDSSPWFTQHGSLLADTKSLATLGLEKPDNEAGLGIRIDGGCSSLALIPIESGPERIGLVQLQAAAKKRLGLREVETCEHLSQTLGVALAHRHLQLALRERVKELTCLYGLARLAAQPEITLDHLLQETVQLLPPGWLYPDSACARIVLGDRTYATVNCRKAVQRMKADLVVDGKSAGFVEVGYIWEKPALDEGPFLAEERNLIDTIAREVSVIVERKQAETKRSRLEDQLQHADRLATIGQLGAGLAHELNEPLANILGFAQLAAKDENLISQTRQDIEKIVSATLHAREVITKLLAFTRESTSEKTPVNLNRLVEDGLHFLQSRCTKAGIRLERRLSERLPEITADRAQLLQVLTNVVVNSIQAMPGGGLLTITTAFEEGRVLVIIEDTGSGMNDDIMKNIFNPFFTTKDADQGTGLGLSIVHTIVTAHGGTIDVESIVDQGSKFTIRLPADTAVAKDQGDKDG
jgi:two-component system NtrC family sensor kinase